MFTARSPVGPIQVLPPGLVNFLQLKIGGYAPDALSQVVTPEFDMLPFWLRATQKNLSDPAGAIWALNILAGPVATTFPYVNTSTLANLTVPDREWWHVTNATARVRNDAGVTTTNFAMAVTSIGGPRNALNIALVGEKTASLAPAIYDVITANEFWMPPGSTFGLWVGDVTGGIPGSVFESLLQGFTYSVLPI